MIVESLPEKITSWGAVVLEKLVNQVTQMVVSKDDNIVVLTC